jgi:tetratricopeptide (TPR) repeat protein
VSAVSTPEPYVGTRPFDREDFENFFGRDREAADLFSLVLAVPAVLIYAASGAGKSSLLNAGLIPRLEKEGFQVLGPAEVTGPVPPEIREITNIYRFHTLSKLNADLSSPIATASELVSLSLQEFLARLDEQEPDRPRALLLDQFEKFFAVSITPSKQRRAFVEELAQASRAPSRLKVVFAMREEYIAQFEVFAYSLPDKLRTRMRLEPLRERAAVEAIRGPLERIGLFFEKGEKDSDNPAEALVGELLKIRVDAGPDEGREITGEFVEPIQLQVVCQDMWRDFPDDIKAYAAGPQGLAREKKIITRDQVKIGNVDQALARHYDRAIEDAARVSGTSQRQLRRWFGSSLITGVGMRGIALASGDETAQLPETALEVFLTQRLVRKESRAGSEWYELTHDRYIEPIQRSNKAWFEQRAVPEALLRRLEAKAETAGAILNESETREAEAFLASPDVRELGPSEKVTSLVRASSLHVEKEARQRRIKLTLAWSTSAVLLVAFSVSIYAVSRVTAERNHARAAEQTAKAAEQRAIEQKGIAWTATQRAQVEIFRTRKQTFQYNYPIQVMASRLVELSTPQEALFWHAAKARALSEMHMHEEAITEYDSILQLDPQNLTAKFGRGYEYYTQREPEKALQDTEAYLQKVPNAWGAHQNRGISLSLLGHFDEAEKELLHAIQEFRFEGREFTETEVAPDIQAATGQATLIADESAGQTANYYELANVKAYAGSEDFDTALTEADKQPKSADAALIALDWAWLQMEKRKEDYGALVAQGALWERAGFNDWAKQSYENFKGTHTKNKDKRYEGLARWAENRLAALKSYGKPIIEKRSVNTLKFEAEELAMRNWLDEALDALKQINSATDIVTDDITPNLDRAAILLRKQRYSECKSECDRILSKAPNTPSAYFYRAVASKQLKETPDIVEADLRKALTYDPNHGRYMAYLSDALYERAEKQGFGSSRRELDEALQLLNSSTSAENLSFDELPYIYYKIARIHCARRNFEEASKSLETAIAIKDDDSDFYTLWRQTQKGLGDNEAQASCSLADVLNRTAETKVRSGYNGKALNFYWRGLEALTADEKQVNEAEVKQEMAKTMSKISQIIERAGSRAKATEFWQSIAKLESMKLLRGGAKAELQRLAKTP